MLLGFLELDTALLIAHVFGAIIGAGGAFTSDSIFFSTMKDGRIDKGEMRFLKIGGYLVWTGLGLLVLSGAAMVALEPQRYLESGKFLVKMSVVAVIIANGILFHTFHIPRMERNLGKKLSASREFVRWSGFLVASGAVSVVSWATTVILGVLGRVPYDYWTILAVYLALVFLAVCGALLMRKRVLHI